MSLDQDGGPPHDQLTRRSARDIAYLQLRHLIVAGDLMPGAPVAEDELAAKVGVSRTPVRESIKTLEAEGLLSRLPNGRLVIVPLTARELQELYAVRAAIERLIVVSVASEVDHGEIDRVLEPLASGIRRALEAHLPEVREYGVRLHHALARLSMNKVASAMLWQLSGRIARYRSIGPEHDPERRLEAAREHLRVWELISSGRPLEAGSAMEEHILRSQALALQLLVDSNSAS